MPKIKSKELAKIDIEHVAALANLKLTPQEKKILENQLSEILQYIQKLDEIDTTNTQPIGQITGLSNIEREDEPKPSLSQKEALQNVPRKYQGFVEVEAILEEQ